MVVASALGSALLYAVASVLQQRAAANAPEEQSLRLGLLTYLASRPLWVVGVAADVGGYALQFYALDRGSLVLVQPLLVSGLLFALPLGAVLSKQRMRAPDWIGAACVMVGLSVFLVVANPDRGTNEASTAAWGVLVLATLIPAAACISVAGRAPGPRRAVLLAAAAGIVYGLTAALTKGTAHLLDAGVGNFVSSWKPYALLVLGIFGMLLAQSAFQAGSLGASLPVLTVVDPVVSIAIGALVFEEGVEIQGAAPYVQVLALAAMAVGVFMLARSPLVLNLEEGEP